MWLHAAHMEWSWNRYTRPHWQVKWAMLDGILEAVDDQMMAIARYGKQPLWWLREEPLEEIRRMFDSLRRLTDAENKK